MYYCCIWLIENVESKKIKSIFWDEVDHTFPNAILIIISVSPSVRGHGCLLNTGVKWCFWRLENIRGLHKVYK